MKITCQSCQSKYTVSDEKVQGKTVKIKCRKCGATILVNSGGVTTSGAGMADPVSVATTTGGGADGGASYLVNVADGDQRSMTLPELVVAYNSSLITGDTYVWADGMNDWQPLSEVEAIVNALNAPAGTPAASQSVPPPEVGTPTPLAAVAMGNPVGVPQTPPVAAVAAPVAVAAAVQEPEHRAAARRDPGRRAQDVFSANEVATSAPAYTNGSAAVARAPAAAPAPGAREENSMLFSLSALTAKAGTSASSSSGPGSAPRVTTAKDREDSGIIDLKALAAAAQAPAQPSASSLLPDTGLFPLGAPATSAPFAAPPVVSPLEPASKSKTPLFIGVGAVVAMGAIIGAFLFMKGGPPPDTHAATADTTPTAAATPTPPPAETASAAPSDSAVASAAPSASADAKGGKGKVVATGPHGGGGPRGGGAATPKGGGASEAPAAPAKPAGGKGNCGCAAGDLMCAMKCSAH